MVSKCFSSLFLTLGVVAPLTGAVASTACSSKFEGCASSRSCPSDAGEGGDGGTSGKGGTGAGGSAGKAGAGGAAGKGGSMSMGGEAGEAGASSGKGGTGGTGGSQGGKGGQGGSGGSSTDPMGGEGGMEMEPEPDVTPPTILSVSPDDGETGVSADAVIQITFSEPMDRETAELAYQSADIPVAATTRRWNADDTVLTITPNSDLLYEEGAKGDLTFAARAYALEMTDTAEDKAGNRLVPEAWSFTTLRRLTQVLTADGDDVRRFNGTYNTGCTNLDLGDYRTNVPLAGFVQFHLSELVPGATTFEVATFYGERIDSAGDPRLLDGVHLYEFEGDILEVDLDGPTGLDLGIFLDSYVAVPRLDVLSAMTSSYATDGLIQFRLKVVPDSDGDGEDDYFRLTCSFDLGLIYLAP